MGEKLENEYLKDIPVVNEDGTPYVPKWYERLDDWMYDYFPVYAQIWRLWKGYLCPFMIKRRIKFFIQRIIRGFDDSETWCLDDTFYKWLYPRLKRFMEVNCAYPTDTTYEDWQNELKKRVEQLKYLAKSNDMDFDDWSYLSKKEIKELQKRAPGDNVIINMSAYDKMQNDFNDWFGNNINQLWW